MTAGCATQYRRRPQICGTGMPASHLQDRNDLRFAELALFIGLIMQDGKIYKSNLR
jgi:hypothetical protein